MSSMTTATTTTSGTPAFLSDWAPRLLSVLRIMAALLYMAHGTQKLLGFPAMPGGRPMPELLTLQGVSGILELVLGVLLVLGLFTRPAAFVASGHMAFAYFIGHAPRNFFPALNGGDAAILFCFVFLYLAASGPGPWSLDAARTGRGATLAAR
ncbi:DoxX family protein [Craurococcus roseus]|uniref:DoxX family protein n=1 Tax=Craurococcus roseus TaxID=77585 RepID=A0ABP3PK48_9PROT